MQSEIDFDEDFAAVHAYLCADGYVCRNPPHQKHKYYNVALRNTAVELLLDFQGRFKKTFGIEPKISRDLDRCKIGSKEIYFYLTKRFGSFYSADWSAPEFISKKTAAAWLRAFFDCESWVTCVGRKSRLIAMDSINHKGLEQIKAALSKFFGINSRIGLRTGRKTGTLFIFGKENLIRYEKDIGFLHPKKARRLKDAIDSFVSYALEFPTDKTELRLFVLGFLKDRAASRYKTIRKHSILRENLEKIGAAVKELFSVDSKIYGPKFNGLGCRHYELCISKAEDVEKIRVAIRAYC